MAEELGGRRQAEAYEMRRGSEEAGPETGVLGAEHN